MTPPLVAGRFRAPADAPRDGELRARGRPPGLLDEGAGLAVLSARRKVVRSRDQHDASVGGVVLVLPAIHRHEVSFHSLLYSAEVVGVVVC